MMNEVVNKKNNTVLEVGVKGGCRVFLRNGSGMYRIHSSGSKLLQESM